MIPATFYYYEERWKLRKIDDYFKKNPPSFQRYVPRYDVMFNDVKKMKDEEILSIRNVAISIIFMTQKHGYDMRSLLSHLNIIYESLKTQ